MFEITDNFTCSPIVLDFNSHKVLPLVIMASDKDHLASTYPTLPPDDRDRANVVLVIKAGFIYGVPQSMCPIIVCEDGHRVNF
jgi:hypothetical protein